MSSDVDKKVTDALENTGLFYWILNSIKKFNDQEVNGILTGQLNTSDRENCFLLVYWRYRQQCEFDARIERCPTLSGHRDSCSDDA